MDPGKLWRYEGKEAEGFLKDWKEYAYEKFVGWEAYNPWEREEWVVNPPVRPDFRAPIRGITTP